jgi:hypothetical protein
MRKANSARSSEGMGRGADARITDVRWFGGTAFVAGEGKALRSVLREVGSKWPRSIAGLESSVGMEEHCWASQQWRPSINR